MGILYPCLIVYPLCVPVLVFPNGLLVVPRVRYLERGTLLFAAEGVLFGIRHGGRKVVWNGSKSLGWRKSR